MYNPDIHHRTSIRLSNHDYTIGRYFVTLAVNSRLVLFGRVIDGKMVMNDAGRMIEKTWLDIVLRFPNVVLDSYIIMPEHFHGIIDLGVNNKAIYELSDLIRFFKSQTTVNYAIGVKENHWRGFDRRLWQRNYYERFIRDELELKEKREYISDNPSKYIGTIYKDF
jgi:putative transposase